MAYVEIRKNGKLVESTWEEALDLIASKYEQILKEDGNTAVEESSRRN